MRNHFYADVGVIDDIQNKMKRMQISKKIHHVNPQEGGRIY